MNTLDSGQYLDLGGLSNLRHDARQSPNDTETLRKVAEQFESLFVHMLLKSQRAANFGDPLFDSNALDTYRDMQDQQMSMELSKSGGFGLADMLVQQLGKHIQPESDTGDLAAQPSQAPGSDVFATVPTTPLVDLDDVSGAVLESALQASQPSEHVAQAMPSLPPRVDAVAEPPVLAAAPIASILEQTLASPASASSADISGVAEPVAPPRVDWSTPEDFVQDVMPHAQVAAESLGVDPRVLVAQAALETGWGRHIPHDTQSPGYNLFGIKADSRWDGERVSWNTLEHDGVEFAPTRAQFRAYPNLGDAVQDYAEFIRGNPRYQEALSVSADPAAYVNALQQAGYATDPNYADKIMQIYSSDRLASAVATG